MFKNVLVGVDGGPNGRDAVALARRLTDPQQEITLANTHSDPGVEAAEVSKNLLEREGAARGASVELESIVADSPGRGLHEQAQSQNADLLVIGSCSHGPFGRVMLGDDTQGAINGAPCAVAIASRGYAQHPSPVTKIGVGYDGSQESMEALATAQRLAAETDATVHALEVVSIPSYGYTGLMPPAIGESVEVMLKEATERLKGLRDVEASAVYGVPSEELVSFGETVDLLIVGSRSYGPLGRLVHGSTSAYLQRHGRCSLLVLPRAASVAGVPGVGEIQVTPEAAVAV